MTWADTLLASRLPITWGTVSTGLSGHGLPRALLTPSEALRLVEILASGEQSVPLEAAELLGLSVADEDELSSCLGRLAAQAGVDLGVETRKWRLLLLEQEMDELPDDPLYALLRLTEFWDTFGYPSDSPHVVQGVRDARDPASYYTQANLDVEIARHRRWAESERAMLGGSSTKT